MLKEYILAKVLDGALKASKKLLKDNHFNLIATSTDIEESLNLHLQRVKNWASEISFKDAKESKLVSEVYIHLNLFLHPRRTQLENIESEKITIDKIPQNKHLILLGEPGAGKTTSLKYLCNEMLFSENGVFENYNYPILLKFRELNNLKSSTFIFDEIFELFGLNIKPSSDVQVNKQKYQSITTKYILKILDSQKIVLFLDGFDELPNIQSKENAIANIRLLVSTLQNSIVIITSRSSDFDYHIENANEYEFSSLTHEQILDFTIKWLGSKEEGKDLYNKILESPFSDTAIRPLTIAHLCALYEKYGHIPPKPKTVYRKIINLMLEEWDTQRSIKRNSHYAKFDIDRKFEFLCALSYNLTIKFKKFTFNSDDLEKIYKKIYMNFELPYDEYKIVVNEIETHTGLLIQNGYDSYEFAHKSLQEYLTAEYIVKLPSIPGGEIIEELPNEFAIAITISSNTSNYFNEFMNNHLINKLSDEFVITFISRLLLEKPEFVQKTEVVFNLLYLYKVYVVMQESRYGNMGYIGSINKNINELSLKYSFGTSMNYGYKSGNYLFNNSQLSEWQNMTFDKILNSLTDVINRLISKNLNFLDIINSNYLIDEGTKFAPSQIIYYIFKIKSGKALVNVPNMPKIMLIPKKVIDVYRL